MYYVTVKKMDKLIAIIGLSVVALLAAKEIFGEKKFVKPFCSSNCSSSSSEYSDDSGPPFNFRKRPQLLNLEKQRPEICSNGLLKKLPFENGPFSPTLPRPIPRK